MKYFNRVAAPTTSSGSGFILSALSFTGPCFRMANVQGSGYSHGARHDGQLDRASRRHALPRRVRRRGPRLSARRRGRGPHRARPGAGADAVRGDAAGRADARGADARPHRSRADRPGPRRARTAARGRGPRAGVVRPIRRPAQAADGAGGRRAPLRRRADRLLLPGGEARRFPRAGQGPGPRAPDAHRDAPDRRPRRGQTAGRLRRLRQAGLLQHAHGRHAAGVDAHGQAAEVHARSVENLRPLRPAEVLPALRAGRLRGVPDRAAAGRRAAW